MTRSQLGKQLTPFISTLALFAVWEAACWAFRIPTFILPKPTEAFAALVDNWSGIWPNALHTLVTTYDLADVNTALKDMRSGDTIKPVLICQRNP